MARRFAAGFVAARDACVDEDTLQLLVTELVTNAIIHTASDVHLRITDLADGLRVEVSDAAIAGDGLSAQLPPPTSRTGRGLLLVERLARRWGVSESVAGKTVWFGLARA